MEKKCILNSLSFKQKQLLMVIKIAYILISVVSSIGCDPSLYTIIV
jgi:hypothetical protein